MKIIISGLRIAAGALLFAVSTYSSSASWDHVDRDTFKSVPLQSISGFNLKQTKREMVSMALQLGVNEGVMELSQQQDKQGNLHSRYQQTYQGLPVWGQHITVHERAGQVYRAKGKIARGLRKDLNEPIKRSFLMTGVDDSAYVNKAMEWVTSKSGIAAEQWSLSNINLSRQVYIQNQRASIVVVAQFLASHQEREPMRPSVIISESTLEIVDAWDGLAHAEATGPGGNVKVGRYEYGTDYGFLEVTEADGVCSMINSNVYTVDLQNGTNDNLTTPFAFPCYENTNREVNGAYAPLNDAHYFGNVVFDMYQDWYALPPLTFQLALKVHYGTNYDNAYWDGQSMVFGDGGSKFYPLVDINVVSHEVSHGFTEQNSGLIYNQQSGGINEAFSDIAGEAAEYYSNGAVDWLVGSAIMKNAPALRYFADPTLDGISIGHADDFYNGIDVHHSSGVFNRAYYLIANSEGWTPQSAFDLFVHANRFYWGPATNFEEGACGVLNAAADLEANKLDVFSAFVEVGVICASDDSDSDEDGMPDGWEWSWGLNPADPSDALGDLDVDGVNNVTEYQYQSNPTLPDSDYDTLSDSDEIFIHHTSPILIDSDTDEMRDDFEILYGLDPLDPEDASLDLDGDGFTNLQEYRFNTDPSDVEDFPIFVDFFFESFESELGPQWETTSDSTSGGWAANTSWYSHGATSYAASGLTHNQRATLRFSGLFDTGILSFKYRTSTESCCDRLYVLIDGVQVLAVAGNNSNSVSLDVSSGAHTIEFIYRKDGSVNSYEDTVWIDSLLFETDNLDADDDGLPNQWEVQYGLDPTDPTDATLDLDEDGATNLQEYEHGSDPSLVNSDSDNLSDGDEINVHGTSPILEDTDGDEIDDGYEVTFGLNPLDPLDAALDLDGDGSSNLEEYMFSTDPTDPEDYRTPYQLAYLTFEDGNLPEGWQITGTGTAQWTPSPTWSSQGHQSLMATGLAGYGTTSLNYTGDFHTGTLTFDYRYRATSGSYFYLRMYVDNRLVLSTASYGDNVTSFSVNLTSGVHSLRIVVENPLSTSHDAFIWLDNLVFETDNTDRDKDGMPNRWEILYGLNPENAADAALDYDQDQLTNLAEYQAGTFPDVIDSDGDQLEDSAEVLTYLTLGNDPDTDDDGMADGFEITFSLDPLNPSDASLDADNDGQDNRTEFLLGTDPADPESNTAPLLILLESFESDPAENWSPSQSEYASPWSTVSSWSSHGSNSLASASMPFHSQASITYLNLFSAGTLSFDYKKTTTSGNRLQLYVDDRLRLTSTSAGGSYSLPLTPGVHQLRWEGTSSNYSGGDFFIDNVRFITSEDDDLDDDGLPNSWEWDYGLDPENPADAAGDLDSDGATNLQEYTHGSNPTLPDSDEDGVSDGDEINQYGSDPMLTDSDDDTMDDGFEVSYGLDPSDPTDADLDLDGDGSSNVDEYRHGTDPSDASDFLFPVSFMALTFENDSLPDGWALATTGSQNWEYSNEWSSQGERSLVSRNLAYGEITSLQYEGWMQAGNLNMDIRTRFIRSSRYYFYVYVDGNLRASHAAYGDTERSYQIPLSAGFHTISIQLRHPSSLSDESAVWIDKIWFEGDATDMDEDGLPNAWELQYDLDPLSAHDAEVDSDLDLLTNLQEFEAGSNPRKPDTDDDGAEDAVEVGTANTLVNDADSDDDGMADGFELQYGLNPLSSSDAAQDLDGDTLSNLDEFRLGTNPNDADSKLNPMLLWQDSLEDGISPHWVLSTHRSVDWSTSTNWSSDGAQSLAQVNQPYYSTASAEFTGLFSNGTFSYDYFISSIYTVNMLSVYLDGVFVKSHTIGSGSGSIDLAAGVHTIRFVTNNSSSSGITSTYLDNLHFSINSDEDWDQDGLPNGWEQQYGLDPLDPSDAVEDLDLDGLTNLQEYEADTDPNAPNVELTVTMSKLFETNFSEVNYRVKVKNQGIVDATQVTVLHWNRSNYLTEFAIAEGSAMNCVQLAGTFRKLECIIDSLPAGAEEVIDLKVQVETTEKHEFVASVSANESDYDSANNETNGAYAGFINWWVLVMLSALYYTRRRVGFHS